MPSHRPRRSRARLERLRTRALRFREEALPRLGCLDAKLDPEWSQRLEVPHECGLCLLRVLLGVDTQTDLRARARNDRVHGMFDGQHVDPGDSDRRAGPEVLAQAAGPEERHSGLDLGQLTELVVAEGRTRPLLASQARHGDVTAVVVQGRERAQHRQERVGRRTAELARVLRTGERPHLDRDDRHPAQADRESGDSRTDAAHVADHHRVGCEELGLRRWIRGERAPGLLLPLDHDLDPDRRPALPGSERPQVHEDVRLGVGCPSAKDRAVALARLEWGRLPLRLLPDVDDVVVPVEQDRGCARRSRDLAHDHRRRVGKLEHLEPVHPGACEEIDDRISALEERGSRVLRIPERGDRRDRDEPLEFVLQLRDECGDRLRGL